MIPPPLLLLIISFFSVTNSKLILFMLQRKEGGEKADVVESSNEENRIKLNLFPKRRRIMVDIATTLSIVVNLSKSSDVGRIWIR
mmetsp:Transcript_17337/g.20009  ORF Transcript_17337/g.20009 Transcript_17337/m.20009 type:complete len:85 (-) Transcript_17337:8-262(-)